MYQGNHHVDQFLLLGFYILQESLEVLHHKPELTSRVCDLAADASSQMLSASHVAKENRASPVNSDEYTSAKVVEAFIIHLEEVLFNNFRQWYWEGYELAHEAKLDFLLERIDFDSELEEDPAFRRFFKGLQSSVHPCEYFVACCAFASSCFYRYFHATFPREGQALRERIVRVLEFEPEYRQSGISILSYFSEILDAKYPEMDVSVKIEQVGSLVTMTIETPEGESEVIERELKEYSLVVLNEKRPEDLLSDQYEVLKLQNRLDLVATELRMTKNLLDSERAHSQARIATLEEQMRFLYTAQENKDRGSASQIDQILAILKESQFNHGRSVEALIKRLESGLSADDEKYVERCLSDIKGEDPGLFEKLSQAILRGAVEGTSGNIFYACLRALSGYG